MIDWVIDYAGSLTPFWFYAFLFVSAYVENIFPPVPGDTVTVFAAYLAGRSQGSFAGVFTSTTLGSISGFMTYYLLGRLIPQDYFIRRNFRFLPASSFASASLWFERHGYWVVLFNRFFSGARSAISIVCGLSRLPWLRVMVLAGIGCGLWNGILIYGGYVAGTNWHLVDRMVREYSTFMLAALAALVALWLIRRRYRRRS